MKHTIIALSLTLASCSGVATSDCNSIGQMSTLEIIKEDTDQVLGKFSIDLRIAEELTEDQLSINAEILKCENPGYERYFITYYLPGYEVGNGAWATSHYNPELSINILRLQD